MSRNLELLRYAQRIGSRRVHDRQQRQSIKPRQSPPFVGAASEPQFLLPLWLILKRHWPWSLGFALLTIASVTTIVYFLPSVYEPTARIELETGQSPLSSSSDDARLNTAQYAETQAKDLQSGELHLEVIRKLGLDRNQQWLGKPPRDGHTRIAPPNTPGSLTTNEYRALELFERSLTVKHDNTSWLIDISFAARDPHLATAVTNGLIEDFIDRDYRTRADAIRESTRFLSQQLDDLRQKMDASTRELADFQKSSGITPVTDSRSSFDERAGELNRQLTNARVERIQLQSLLQEGRNNPSLLSQVSGDPAVQDISKQLSAARAQQKEALVIYGGNHPKAKQLAAQVQQLQSELNTQQNRALANIENSYGAAHTREKLLDAEVRDAAKQMGVVEKFEALKKESQANEDLYKTLYGKLKETAILGEAAPRNIRWIDHARVLDKPTRPRRLLDVAAGIVAGIFGGIILAFVRESVNTKVRTLDDVKGWAMEPANVSLVPLVTSPLLRLRGKRSKHSSRQPFVLERPNSPEAEAVRGLVTSIAPWHGASAPRVLLVASSQPGEGKTTIAANLAIALSRGGKTCLVDADLRNPVIGAMLNVHQEQGLAALLAGKCALNDAMVDLETIDNLTLLPGGKIGERSGDLITAEKIENLLNALRERFQYVIVDSPPLLPYADSRVLARLGDGIVMVARAGTTTLYAFKRSLDILQSLGAAPVLEVVLNAVPHNSADYGYHYKYVS